MTAEKTTGSYVLNLLILGVTIILVLVAKNNPMFANLGMPNRPPQEGFGGGGGGFGGYNYMPRGVQPTGQPMMYPRQIYPAKMPYYPETGRPCNGKLSSMGCGSTGVCTDGICHMKDQNNTVFNIPV
jgi:hypothetical protein